MKTTTAGAMADRARESGESSPASAEYRAIRQTLACADIQHIANEARSRAHRVLLVAIFLVTVSGCASLPNGRLWGEAATLTPGWDRVRTSAVQAARDPWVWGPALGAAAFQIDDWDRRTSDWAREHTPVFGSQRSAEQWSDDLKSASIATQRITLIATPGGDDATEWLLSKAKGALVQVSAMSATSKITHQLKESTDRERPNGLAKMSFPSGHTSAAAVSTRLASENLESIQMSNGTRRALDAGLIALTLGTSWARIEAGWHFPSDTLFSMALGNFIGSFVNDAFLGLEDSHIAITFGSGNEGLALHWTQSF